MGHGSANQEIPFAKARIISRERNVGSLVAVTPLKQAPVALDPLSAHRARAWAAKLHCHKNDGPAIRAAFPCPSRAKYLCLLLAERVHQSHSEEGSTDCVRSAKTSDG